MTGNRQRCAVAFFSYLPCHEAAFGETTTGFGKKKQEKKNKDQNSFAWQNRPPTQKHVRPSWELKGAQARADICNAWHLTPASTAEAV